MRAALAAALLLAGGACLAQDADLEALRARQARLKEKGASVEERAKARADRGTEITRVVEQSIAEIAKQGVEFRKLSDDEATAQFPQYEKVSGRGAGSLVVRVDNSYTHELELVAQPVGGKLMKISWSFYKDGSFKVGENPSRGGTVFFTGANYLDRDAVLPRRKELKAGLVKYMSAAPDKP